MAGDEAAPKGLPANDNGIETRRRIDALVLTVARALGCQIAREEFARLRAEAANDNQTGSNAAGEMGPGDQEDG